MNDVSKCDVIHVIWHFDVKVCQFDCLNILYFQAKFGKERSEIEQTKLLYINRNCHALTSNLGDDLALAWYMLPRLYSKSEGTRQMQSIKPQSIYKLN